jgi:hypothetical protein
VLEGNAEAQARNMGSIYLSFYFHWLKNRDNCDFETDITKNTIFHRNYSKSTVKANSPSTFSFLYIKQLVFSNRHTEYKICRYKMFYTVIFLCLFTISIKKFNAIIAMKIQFGKRTSNSKDKINYHELKSIIISNTWLISSDQ